MKSGIYAINIREHVYVGSAKNIFERYERHKKDLVKGVHHNIILQRIYDKYGFQDFKLEILENIPYEKTIILERENFWINNFRKSGASINLADASFGDVISNHPLREDIISKISNSMKNLNSLLTKEERSNLYGNKGAFNGMFGKKHSEEAKFSISIKNKSKWDEEDFREKMRSIHKERSNSEEWKNKISNFSKQRVGYLNPFYGKKHSQAAKDKISEANRGKKASNRRKVEADDVVYQTVGECAEAYNISSAAVLYRIRNSKYQFSYV